MATATALRVYHRGEYRGRITVHDNSEQQTVSNAIWLAQKILGFRQINGVMMTWAQMPSHWSGTGDLAVHVDIDEELREYITGGDA